MTTSTMWFVIGLTACALTAGAVWFVRWRQPLYRKALPRIYELRDLIPNPVPPAAYFRNLDQSLSENPIKLRQFRDIEADLAGLDARAWALLKSEVTPLLTAKDAKRGWQPLFDKLNQAKAFNYLKRIGCASIEFIPGSTVTGQQTPDLQAELDSTKVLCEVKTVNISESEANRRYTGGVGTSTDQLGEGFFGKLGSDLKKAKAQMLAYCADNTRKIAYVIVNFDDGLHEYVDRYRLQIDRYVATNPVADLTVVFDIKPAFYTATA
jgi:hypothetical protein